MDGRAHLNPVGLLFALAAATCWGLYILVGAALGRHTTQGNGLALAMAVAALVACANRRGRQRNGADPPPDSGCGARRGPVVVGVPFSLELEALRKIPPRVFGILMSLEPTIAALISLIVLQECLHRSQWITVLCVVAASAGATLGARRDD